MKINIKKRKIFLLSSLLILTAILGYWGMKDFHNLIHSEVIAEDFVAFWSAGRLLLNGTNPYSSEHLFALQQQLGRTKEFPLFTYYQPWGLPFILPFCVNNYYKGKFYWLLSNIILTVLSMGCLM